jgi:hypothetical protein
MENLYSVIGLGPANLTQPSQGNWQTVYSAGSTPVKPPTVNNAA